MEILKGMVREKGFEDKECTYMKTDDGKQYYFIEDFQLSNGNIIACSDLSQGVGNKPRQTLGVITPKGEVVIPFENKMIKPLENNLLLVEKNAPTTQNVIDALTKKEDPTVASQLMNDANNIKVQLKSVMAGSENFLFDNLFSEAALYTLEGVNVGGGYFSFIGQSGNDYFLSTNIAGSSILKYDSSITSESNNQMNLSPESSQEMPSTGEVAEPETNQTTSDVTTNQEDSQISSNENDISQEPLVPNIEIPLQLQQQVEEPSNQETTTSEEQVNNDQVQVELPNNENNQEPSPGESQNPNEVPENQPEPTLNLNLSINDTSQLQDTQTDSNEVQNENDSVGNEIPQEQENNEISNQEENNNNEMSLNIAVENEEDTVNTELPEDNKKEEEESNNNEENNNSSEEIANDNIPNQELSEEEVTDNETTDDNPDSEGGEIENDLLKEENSFDSDATDENPDDSANGGMVNESFTEEESYDNVDFSSDTYDNQEYMNDMQEDYQEEITNPVIIDATNTIRKLLEENRRQREIIDRQDSEIETLTSSNSILKENNDSKSKEIISLRNGMVKYRNQNSSLTRENNSLKATNTRQAELIENLKNQNITLKEQVAGIRALGNAVKEATTVIETHQEEKYNPSSDFSYLDNDLGEIAYQKVKTS